MEQDTDDDVKVIAESSAEGAESGRADAQLEYKPLVLELTPEATARKLLSPLLDALCRGGGIEAKPYRLTSAGTNILLVRVGFREQVRASLGALSRSEERKVLHDFVSQILLDPKTASGRLLTSIAGVDTSAVGGPGVGTTIPLVSSCKQQTSSSACFIT